MAAHAAARAAQAPPSSTGPPAPRKPRPSGPVAWFCSHQLGESLLLLLTPPPEYLESTALTPSPSFHLRNPFSRFLLLSFRKPGTSLYYKGRDDAFFIAWWVIAFGFIRDALMRWMFVPIARLCGIRSKRELARFAEQGWQLCYCSISFSIGLYINQTSEYRNLNTLYFWKGYPHDELPALTKWYYLVYTAFWIHQIITINLEARRRDYYQMFTHHIITFALMAFSYVLNWTRIGNTILCTMDLCDIFLSAAKLFKYVGKTNISDATFAVFLVTWLLTRHVIFGKILYSVVTEPQTVLEYGWRSEEGYFFSRNMQVGFALLLAALQVLMCIWLYMIFRVLYGMFLGKPADDVRSDDEGDDSLEDEPAKNGSANGHSNGHANGHGFKERKKDR
ncbi:hypothetical protein JCM10207_001771 [Rhodosporidiobolus poonsookiae]